MLVQIIYYQEYWLIKSFSFVYLFGLYDLAMITEIQIKDCACFDHAGVTVNSMKEINFIYGPNGSGKSTISNVIAHLNEYPQCQIVWKNNRVLKSFVYNRTFIDDNFGRSRYQKGIFTLGKGEKGAKEIIAGKRSEIDK